MVRLALLAAILLLWFHPAPLSGAVPGGPPAYREALRALDDGETLRGIGLLREVLADDPFHAQALYHMGLVHRFTLKDAEQARLSLQRSVSLGLEDPERGRALFILGRMAEQEWEGLKGQGPGPAQFERFMERWPGTEAALTARLAMAQRLAGELGPRPERGAAEAFVARYGDLPVAGPVREYLLGLRIDEVRVSGAAVPPLPVRLPIPPAFQGVDAADVARNFISNTLNNSMKRVQIRPEIPVAPLEVPAPAAAEELVVAFVPPPPGKDELLYAAVAEEGTEEAFQRFLDQFPDSPWAEVAARGNDTLRGTFRVAGPSMACTLAGWRVEAVATGWLKRSQLYRPRLWLTVTNTGGTEIGELTVRTTLRDWRGAMVEVRETSLLQAWDSPIPPGGEGPELAVAFDRGLSPHDGTRLAFSILVAVKAEGEDEWSTAGEVTARGRLVQGEDPELTFSLREASRPARGR